MEKNAFEDRRSSVRVRSLLPCAIRKIDALEIDAVEAQILDVAVLESDGIIHDVADWSERTDELPREVVFVLNEMRALRQQVTELQRMVSAQGQALEPRWMIINDKGLWIPSEDADELDYEPGDNVEIRLQIPSLQTPDILAIGEVIRVSEEDEDETGFAIVFRSISQAHSKAIIRYALRRERQLARSLRFH